MARGLCPAFDPEAFRDGHLTPVFFGSALNNFGVRELLRGIAALAPPPRPQPALGPTAACPIRPDAPEVAGFRVQGAGQYRPAASRPHRLCAALLGPLSAAA